MKWVQLDYLSWRHPHCQCMSEVMWLKPFLDGNQRLPPAGPVLFLFCTFRACSSNGSTGLRAGCPSQLNQQIQHSPQHTECARMGPWGSAWFATCVFDTVRAPVIGPFSVGALQTGSCSSVLAARYLCKVHCTIFGSQMTEWLLPASLAHLQDFKWAKNENIVFSRALVKPHKC